MISAPAATTSMVTVRELLDGALLILPRVADPAIPVWEAERELASALEHAYRALGCGGDYRVFVGESRLALARARDALAFIFAFDGKDAGIAGCKREVGRAIAALERVQYSPLPEPLVLPRPDERKPPLLASVGVPRLLDPARDVLRPAIPLSELPGAEPAWEAPEEEEGPSPESTPAELDALARAAQAEAEAFAAAQQEPPEKTPAEPPPPPRAVDDALCCREHFGVAVTREALLLGHARACMEELAMHGLQRRPSRGEPWLAPRTEARLLAKLDGIVSCGVWVLPHMVKLLEGRPLPDPELTWANLFLFGSLAGDDALDQVRRLLALTPLGSRAMRQAVVDALAVAPHPGIDAAVLPWLRDEDWRRRAVAVRVLSRRRSVTVEQARVATGDRDRRVVLAGAHALGVARGEAGATLFQRLLFDDDPRIVRASLRSCTLRRLDVGQKRARQLLAERGGAFAHAALFVALGAGHDALPLLLEDAATEGSPTLVRALGWFGDLGPVDHLIGRLQGGPPGVVAAAAEALWRLTGAALTDDAPAPTYEAGDEPFLRPRADPTRELLLSTKAVVWETWWREHRDRATPGKRYRYGHEWTLWDDLAGLEDPLATPSEREVCHLELVARSGATLPFDGRRFIAHQRAEIAALHGFLAERRDLAAQGGWPTRGGGG